ncbi:hypothetical protein GCM10009827_095290 [Dactylosporangium maewongense]|uniref:Uncharacterized protein n=1 Tax=Dactylosporangium maewongense TaxID=634393 RepID=A0ABN2CJN0_9ACTN
MTDLGTWQAIVAGVLTLIGLYAVWSTAEGLIHPAGPAGKRDGTAGDRRADEDGGGRDVRRDL